MKRKHSLLLLFLCAACSLCSVAAPTGKFDFSISMDRPSTHYFHVSFTCDGLPRRVTNFKLPSWTPGYYWLENYAKNLVNFKATDGNGAALEWIKTAKGTWQVATNNAGKVVVSYDMYANTQSVADPFIDATHAYIPPAGLLMYVEGQLVHPATIHVLPFSGWATISTGLEKVPSVGNTFTAPDFDALYDCPLLIGNQELWSFEVNHITHEVAVMQGEKYPKEQFLADLKKMVEAATGVIGDIPYKHYTFLIMGEGRGGLEHRNSCAVFSSGTVYNANDAAGYKRWMSFLAHEFFHLYNIKSIRPIALGPFDYDKENLTHMLWVSEGFTVYYEYVVLVRAGILSTADCLEQIRGNIRNYEGIPGHLFQSATESSFDTWIQFFARGDNASNTTISYYDKGCVLGFMLDLAIRQSTHNTHCLDDVMKALYHEFYQEKKRGFTDQEFRVVCERIAGISLDEIFRFASTTIPVDYPKYFGYAGLYIDTTGKTIPGAFTGMTLQQKDNKLTVTGVEWNSAAWNAGISATDVIEKVDGVALTATTFTDLLQHKQAGDVLVLEILQNTAPVNLNLSLGKKTEKSFTIAAMPVMSAAQKSIYETLFKPLN